MRRYLGWALAVATAALMAACGGGGGAEGNVCLAASCGESSSSSSGGTAASVALLVSSPTLTTNGSSTVTVQAVVKDANNGGIEGASVTIAASSGTLSASAGTTDKNGTVTVTFDTNGDKSNRAVTITAKSGGASATNSIVVSGTTVTFRGASSAIIGTPTNLTIGVKDAGGNTVSGATVSLSSSLGNPIPSSVRTDATGTATFKYTPSKAGSDVISASALGATAAQTIATGSASFAFVSPVANENIALGECRPVTVSGFGFAEAPSNILFSATRGRVHVSTDCSDTVDQVLLGYSGGEATAYVSSPSSGAAVLSATALALDKTTSLATATVPVMFVSVVPTSLTVQAAPSTVSANGTSAISAILRDANGNAVANRTVVFSVNGGGQISPTTVITDSSGTATTNFTADSAITGTGAVTVNAALQGDSAIRGTTNLTVSGLGVNIVMGTDNLLAIKGTPEHYQMAWGVSVTDSNGSPVSGKSVTISLRAIGFFKGLYQPGKEAWLQDVVDACVAEDTNNNGNIDAGEPGDLDADGLYEPNGAAAVMATSDGVGGSQVVVTTNASGQATFYLDYFKNFGSWVVVELRATTTVFGKNSS
ncbi:MAG: hypothetical protein RJA63_545, partial [Pseudomonadota bacterium]